MKIYTDGSGNGKIGYIIEHDGQKIKTETEDIGDCTNNIAEYTAVLKALEYVTATLGIKGNIEVISDSQLVVNQLSHNWHIKDDSLRELAKKVWDLIQQNQLIVTFTWVRRKENPAGKLLG